MQPLFVEADLLHMNIVRGHRLIAASDPLVLREKHNVERASKRLALVCKPEANESTPLSFYKPVRALSANFLIL